MNIKRIFIDIDGVLNRFHAFLLLHFGAAIDAEDDQYRFWNPMWGDDGLLVAIEHHTGKVISEDELWQSLPESVWSDAPLSSEAAWLVDYCQSLVGKRNVALLTSDSSNANSSSGKVKWIEKHFPAMGKHRLIGHCKYMCAWPGVLLIDDRDPVVASFREAGGQTLLVPRPWNSRRDVQGDRETYLREQLLEWVK